MTALNFITILFCDAGVGWLTATFLSSRVRLLPSEYSWKFISKLPVTLGCMDKRSNTQKQA